MIPQEILFKEAYILIQAAKSLGSKLDPVIDLVYQAVVDRRYVVLTGIGKNSDIAKKTHASFSSLGIPSMYLDAYEALHGDLGSLMSGQVIISFSKSGQTEELVATLDSAGAQGLHLISITCNQASATGQIARKHHGHDIVLPCEFEADQNNLAPTCSSTLFLAVSDAIGCCVSERLKFTKEDFLHRHPAGSLGKRLAEELK